MELDDPLLDERIDDAIECGKSWSLPPEDILRLILRKFRAHRFKKSKRPLQVHLKFDGGPTKKEEGYVGLYICFDQRLCPKWKRAPQSKFRHFHVAGYFGKEAGPQLSQTFKLWFDYLEEHTEAGIMVVFGDDGCHDIKLQVVHVTDQSAEWKGHGYQIIDGKKVKAGGAV